MRPILVAVVAAALLVACGRGAPSPLPADQPPAFNDADVGFLQAMIPHHQQAIDMAKLATGRTRRPSWSSSRPRSPPATPPRSAACARG